MSSKGNIILDNVDISNDLTIGYQNLIGIKRKRLNVKYKKDLPEENRKRRKVILGKRIVIRNKILIHEGVFLGDDTYIDDCVRIGADTKVNEGSMILYGAFLMENILIGENCRIAGFIPSNVIIGNNVTMMGHIAHKYDRPLDWSRNEPSPIFEDNVVVGIGALIIGGVKIGKNSYIAGNATVTKDIPENSVVIKTNEIYTNKEFNLKKHKK